MEVSILRFSCIDPRQSLALTGWGRGEFQLTSLVLIRQNAGPDLSHDVRNIFTKALLLGPERMEG